MSGQVVSSDGSRVEVWLGCDQAAPAPLRLTISTLLWTSFTPSHARGLDISCAAAGASLVADWGLQELLQEGGCSLGSYDQHRLQYCLLSFSLESLDTATTLHTSQAPVGPETLQTVAQSSEVSFNHFVSSLTDILLEPNVKCLHHSVGQKKSKLQGHAVLFNEQNLRETK